MPRSRPICAADKRREPASRDPRNKLRVEIAVERGQVTVGEDDIQLRHSFVVLEHRALEKRGLDRLCDPRIERGEISEPACVELTPSDESGHGLDDVRDRGSSGEGRGWIGRAHGRFSLRHRTPPQASYRADGRSSALGLMGGPRSRGPWKEECHYPGSLRRSRWA